MTAGAGPEPLFGPGHRRPGARPAAGGGFEVVVWAPQARRLAVEPEGAAGAEAEPGEGGTWRAELPGARHGQRYRLRLEDDHGTDLLPDPASRWQPDGVFGPSAFYDPGRHRWGDDGFAPPAPGQLVVYQCHIGTLTAAGTLDAAVGALDHVVALGATAVEPLPLAQFSGRHNWGYDGVFPYAVHDTYGGPEAMARFVDACHARGLAVVADVVYNHLGPEGNVLPRFGPYLTDRYRTPWGDAVNVDGPGSDDVRRYLVANALMWLEDFHVDALRLDAIHGIVDTTARPFLAELAEHVAAVSASTGRRRLLIAESADNDPAVVTARPRGLGLDAQWNDDFHHALRTLLTGETTGYYQDFGRPEQLAVAYRDGFVFQGQYNRTRRRRHGLPPTDVRPDQLVVFSQNHDQIGNRPRGERLGALVGTARLRLAAVATVLAPFVPMIFMGEEYGETAPFPFFVDHRDPGLLEAVRRGRAAEMGALWDAEPLDPADPATFAAAKVDRGRAGRGEHAGLWVLYRRLLALRAAHRALGVGETGGTDATVDGRLLAVHRRAADGEAVVLCNLGEDGAGGTLPAGPGWSCVLDGGDPDVGGDGDGRLPARLDGGAALALPGLGFGTYLRPAA